MFNFFAKDECKNENIFRAVVEAARSSLDINDIKKKIIYVIGKALKADRCFIIEYDKQNNRFKEHYEEYLSSPNIKSYIGVDLNEYIALFTSKFKEEKYLIYNTLKNNFNNKETNLDDDSLKKEVHKGEQEVYSAIVFPLHYANEFLGGLFIHYIGKKHKAEKKELNMMETVTAQIAIALYQANLFNLLILKTTNQNAILKNMPFQAWIKDKNGVYLAVNDKFCENYKLEEKEIVGKTDFTVSPQALAEKYTQDDAEIMKTHKQKKTEENIYTTTGLIWAETYKSPFYDEHGSVIGTVGFSQDITERKEYELNLLARQEEIIKANKKAFLLKEITENIRSTLDINELFTLICKELTDVFNIQRASIAKFKVSNNNYEFGLKKEFKISNEIIGLEDNSSFDTRTIEYLAKTLLDAGGKIVIDNIEESDTPDYFKETYKSLGVKSIMEVAIKLDNDSWGWVSLSNYNNHKHWSEDDVSLLETIADQIYIAIHQAELYENQKIMTERERISKNIIEILRSSIDKNIIKKLFVKNIGKFFNADRVLLSEYDDNNKIYLPVDENSEYLSSQNEKSFIGYDWAKSEAGEYIQPILEKREFHIQCWDEYIQQNSKSAEFIDLFTNADVKSSYNFPVFYQQNIMGFFSIEFTHQVTRLSEEEINRIRNMCTQAGIALYHAELYQKAQQCFTFKEAFIFEFSEQVENTTNKILDKSTSLYEKELERKIQIEYLNTIINACNDLLELTKNISEN